MGRLRIFTRVRIIARRRPLSFLVSVLLFIALCAALLEQFGWGRAINRFVPLLFSAESFVWIWFERGWSWAEVLGLLFLADGVSFCFDFFVIRQLFFTKFFVQIVAILSKIGKAILGGNVNGKPIKELISDGMQWNPALNFASGVKKNPSKANLFTVCFLAMLPRFVTIVMGGTAIAVLVVQYNRFGAPGWLALFVGMAIRTFATVLFWELFVY